MNLDPAVAFAEPLRNGLPAFGQTNVTRVNPLALADQLGEFINELSGQKLGFDNRCLSDRAKIMNLEKRQIGISIGGATRLIKCRDGVVALPLARQSDIEMLPALFEFEIGTNLLGETEELWDLIGEVLSQRSVAEIRERAILLGMPLGVLDETVPPTALMPAIRTSTFGTAGTPSLANLQVLELAPMWAGPLCGKVLAQAGAQVTKIESASRPDGTREGSMEFFIYLNSDKRQISIDFGSRSGIEHLQNLIASSDVVIEGSRPRALEQLGIDAISEMKSGQPSVWLSITGHGRDDSNAMRVAFGDDAAISGGLCERDPLDFAGDALADPLSGLAGAVAVLCALKSQQRCLIDLAMARVAALCSTRNS